MKKALTQILFAGLCLFGSSLSAQSALVVGPFPPMFQSVDSAVSVASPGDTIVVRSGSYPGFTVDRGVTVIADVASRFTGVVAVQSVPAGQIATLRGVRLADPGGRNPFGLRISNNAGIVRLESSSTAFLALTYTTFVSILRSARVEISSSDLTVASGLDVVDSSVLIRDSQVQSVARAGLICDRSNVVVASSSVSSQSTPFALAGPGVLLNSGSLQLARGALVSGATMPYAPPTPGVVTQAGATLCVDPGVSVIVSGPVSATTEALAALDVEPLRQGASSTVSLRAPAGVNAAVFLQLPGPRSQTPFGDLWGTGPATVIFTTTGTNMSWNLAVPVGTPLSTTVGMQAVTLDPGVGLPSLAFSTPVVAVVGT